MEYSLRTLAAVAIAVLVVAGARGQGPEVGGRRSEVGGRKAEVGGRRSETGTAEDRRPTADNRLMADAARRLAEEPRVSAEMRYRVQAFDQELIGTGRYLQLKQGAEMLARLEMRLQLGAQAAVVQEIRGADTYWVRREVPPGPATLGRVDLKQLRRSLAAATPAPASEVLSHDRWIMLGGLARLMAALEENFEFTPGRAEELPFNSPDGKAIVRLPIWRVEGTWKPARLAALLGHEPAVNERLPEQLPDRVELVLGRSEEILPLFPYRITYWKTPAADPSAKDEPAPRPRELLTLELFNVSRRPIEAREFEYHPGDQRVEELTPQYAQRLSGETKTR